jgi:D-alanyl-D-alanine carboxypeptidase
MREDVITYADELGISLSSLEARGLVPYEEADDLELVGIGENGRQFFLIPEAAAAWHAMKSAAEADGIRLVIKSAFRSIERQAEIVRTKLAAGQPIAGILRVCAAPGYSEHHTGRALDLTTPGVQALETVFDQTPAFAWLTKNAGNFGFHLSYPRDNPHGYVYEPWHWCFHA